MHVPEKLELNIEGFADNKKRNAFFSTEELEKEVDLDTQAVKVRF
jgi:hypothetical protein